MFDESPQILDGLFKELEYTGGGGKEKFANELFSLIKSKDISHVLGASNINYDNIIWAFGRLVLHYKLAKKYYLSPDKVKADLEFCRLLLLVTSAMEGRRMEQFVDMIKTNFISMNIEQKEGKRLLR